MDRTRWGASTCSPANTTLACDISGGSPNLPITSREEQERVRDRDRDVPRDGVVPLAPDSSCGLIMELTTGRGQLNCAKRCEGTKVG